MSGVSQAKKESEASERKVDMKEIFNFHPRVSASTMRKEVLMLAQKTMEGCIWQSKIGRLGPQ